VIPFLFQDAWLEATLSKKSILWTALSIFMLTMVVVQFVPAPALLIPAQLPAEQRNDHRLLNFEGIANLRDLGGYATIDGEEVAWGKLYRSATFAQASRADLANLDRLGLTAFVDFRSTAEKEEEPNRLPEEPGFEIIDIPILDEGNEALVGDVMARIESGDFDGFDPEAAMMEANRQFANVFTPQISQFVRTVLDADGAPVLWHCSAGKDRTGFAAAVLLRILGVPQETVMQDYMASLEPALASRRNQLLLLGLFKGQDAADTLQVMMGVQEAWLEAAFTEIDATWGSFDNYVHDGLGLSDTDIERLKSSLLMPATN
jgi:protein-tyrosine phosphatase